jgi:16S rRNA (cytosine967-C5)-methyltransferase
MPANAETSGQGARDAAVAAVHAVLTSGKAFDEIYARAAAGLEPRDRAFGRAIASAVLRHQGSLKHIVSRFIEKPLPEKRGRIDAILLCAAAQLVLLQTPPHAAVSIAVEQCRADSEAQRFAKLANAVLRRVSEQGAKMLAEADGIALDIPAWLLARWKRTYGEPLALAIAQASLTEAALDITVKSDAAAWAEKLGATLLPAGSLRLTGSGRVDELPGFSEGAWWVQDAAAALPATLLGDVRGLDVVDLCAAPGGKTAQLINAGAHVTALEVSRARLDRLEHNLDRLGFKAETIVADAAQWSPGRTFDAVLLDAPCTATGTIRRHPDILRLKRSQDVAALAQTQRRILDNAARLVKPGGMLVYCTCSLEPEEGVALVERFLSENAAYARSPIGPEETGGQPDWITPDGDLRTLPVHLNDQPEGARGLDGFFAARLKHQNA